MDRPPAVTRGRRRSLHPLQSVRVRITLTAALVTAVAVGGAGWLLVRSVENEQIHELRGDVEANLDQVAERLEAGVEPCPEPGADPLEQPGEDLLAEAMRDVATFGFVSVTYEDGCTRAFATGLRTSVGSRALDVTAGGPPADAGGAAAERVDPPDGEVAGGRPGDTADGGGSDGNADRQVTVPDGRDSAGAPVPEGAFVIPGPEADGGPTPGVSPGLPGGTVGGAAGLTTGLETISRTVETPDGRLTVTVAVPVDQMARSLAALRGALTVGLPAAIAVVAGLVWVLVGRALRPVEAIRAEVDAITGSTMYRRVPEPVTGDEIGRLARTMNAMLGRLDAAATRQRQFVSDASHELRSPVAAIRTCLEVARRSPERANWPAVADTALAEESRLEALLDDLLLLASHDEVGAAPRADAAVDLRVLAEAEARRPRPVAVRVTRPPDGSEPLVVPGDADQLTRALGNLVDNAVRYAADAVHVDLSRRGDVVRVTVDDDGPGVPVGAREQVFERFARLDDGRARDQGGTGLGLAVVRSIAARHRGLVWVEDSPLGGARFVVELHATRQVTVPGPAPAPVG